VTAMIKLILDEGAASGKLANKGYCLITPTMRFGDPDDNIIVGRGAQIAHFRQGVAPFVLLYPNDLIGPQQEDGNPGWGYQIEYSTDFPGHPNSWTFYLKSTDGATQRLSQLVGTPIAQRGLQYVPLPVNPADDSSQILGISSLSPLVTEWVDLPIDSGPAVVTLSVSESTVAVDASLGNIFDLTLTESTWTISNPTNAHDGKHIKFRMTQDSIGSRTISWDTDYDFAAAGAQTLSMDINKVDIIDFEYISASGKWRFLGISKG